MKRLAVFSIVLILCLSSGNVRAADADVKTLPGTQPLTWTGDLSVRIVEGADRFLDRKLAESVGRRRQFWQCDSPRRFLPRGRRSR